MRVHDGTNFVEAPPRVHDGTNWVEPNAAYVYSNGNWVEVWRAQTVEMIDSFDGGLHAGWQGGDANDTDWEPYTTRKMEGTHSVRAESSQNDSLNIYSNEGQGLPRYFHAGERAHFHFYNSSDDQDINHLFRWGVGSGSGWGDVFIRNGITTPDIILRRETTSGHQRTADRTTWMLPFDKWIRVEITRGDGATDPWGVGSDNHRVKFYDCGADGTGNPYQISRTLNMTADGPVSLAGRSGIRHWISSGLNFANEYLLDNFYVVLP